MTTICAQRGCRRLIPAGTRRCPEHTIAESPHAHRIRDARRKRDGRNTAAWTRLRKAVLERDHHQCQLRADDDCTRYATSVHKIDGGHHTADTADYLSACPHCHGVTDSQARRGRAA